MHPIAAAIDPRPYLTRGALKPTVVLVAAPALVLLHRWLAWQSVPWATTPSAAALWPLALAFLLFGVVPALIVKLVFRERLADYGVRLGDWKLGMAIVAVLGLIGVLLVYPVTRLDSMRSFYPVDPAARESVSAFVRLQLATLLLFLPGWEFLHRGFMLHGLRGTTGEWVAVCAQIIPSALWHIGMPVAVAFAALPAGILFALITLRTRSIYWALLLHFLVRLASDLFTALAT